MRLNPFKQVDFLYFYSLQAGVVMCSSIGIVISIFYTFKNNNNSIFKFLSITTLTVNLASENPEIDGKILLGHYLLICVYGLFALLGFSLGLMAAYQESRPLALSAALVQLIMFVYWLIFLILSFTNKPEFIRRFCIDNRCPDHLWIQDSRWRVYTNTCDPADLKLPLLSNSKQPTAQIIKSLQIIDGKIIFNNKSIVHNFTIKPEKMTFQVKKSIEKPVKTPDLYVSNSKKPTAQITKEFQVTHENLFGSNNYTENSHIKDTSGHKIQDNMPIINDESIVHNFTLNSEKITQQATKYTKEPVKTTDLKLPIWSNSKKKSAQIIKELQIMFPSIIWSDKYTENSDIKDTSEHKIKEKMPISIINNGTIVHNFTEKITSLEKSLENPDEGSIIVNLQDDYDGPGVQEKLWVPHSGIGKTGLIVASAIFTFFIAFFLIYSVTTLMSYRHELAELEELED